MWRRGNKFGAKRARGVTTGRLYDSTAERDRAEELHALAAQGVLADLEEQPRIELESGIFYKPDFAYTEGTRRVWEDVKGVTTERFRLICKLWALHGPGPLRITKRAGRGSRFVTTREILPRR